MTYRVPAKVLNLGRTNPYVCDLGVHARLVGKPVRWCWAHWIWHPIIKRENWREKNRRLDALARRRDGLAA